jgi:hypothetical protein
MITLKGITQAMENIEVLRLLVGDNPAVSVLLDRIKANITLAEVDHIKTAEGNLGRNIIICGRVDSLRTQLCDLRKKLPPACEVADGLHRISDAAKTLPYDPYTEEEKEELEAMGFA